MALLSSPSSSKLLVSSPELSSKLSLGELDEENATITASRTIRRNGKQKSQEDLRLLAISTHMTELSYAISDIQTRIFEIQELRHKSHASSSGDAAGTTAIIDQSLMSLDERLESLSNGIKSVNQSLDPLLQNSSTPTIRQGNDEENENTVILRKHATLLSEWEGVQEESEVLREELKEDKWLTVFRTVTDQADGMMSSLEKGVNRCQEFIWQVYHREEVFTTSPRNAKNPPTFETFTSLLESFEAKKKHYMPATTKVLSIIDKGVRDRVTKNGETLRRHAESAQRWRNLRDRIKQTDQDMDAVRKLLLNDGAVSEAESSTSNGYLATPSRQNGTANSISRSMSPLKKFARRITGSGSRSPSSPVTPLPTTGKFPSSSKPQTPSSEPTLNRQRKSIFNLRTSEPLSPSGHKHSQSLITPESQSKTLKGRPQWNSSTKVDETAAKTSPAQKRDTPERRSLSRASMASSRPWSPLTSSVSTNNSISGYPPMPTFRPPSRTTRAPSRTGNQTPSRAQTPSRGSRVYTPGPYLPTTISPRARPRTPSNIPAPAKFRHISGAQSEYSFDDDRSFSPAFSTTSAAAGMNGGHPPRPPSRSMIPVPSVQLSGPSRPSSSLSNAPSSANRSYSRAGSQTPEPAMRAKLAQLRPSLPPSSFRSATSMGGYSDTPLHEYTPSNPNDPLDAEVAMIVNSLGHGLLVERVDPPLKKLPKEGEEVKAQYAFSNALSRKIVTCRLTTLTRLGRGDKGSVHVKKVMCRVGGGWQDLAHYILNRQAGI